MNGNLTCDEIVSLLKSEANPANVEGMARYGISTFGTLGVSMPILRGLARRCGRDHPLALLLWDTGLHEARILASLIADPLITSPALMDSWAAAIDSWDVCDQCCSNLFRRTSHAWAKAAGWTASDAPFTKRAAFVLMAQLAVHDKKAPNEDFEPFLALIEKHSGDDRNFVKKAVNWALRSIGKRNIALNARACSVAESILSTPTRSARWIASDALRELRDPCHLEYIATRKRGNPQ